MKISDLLELLNGITFLACTAAIFYGLPQGLKNAVKAEHEKIYQRTPLP